MKNEKQKSHVEDIDVGIQSQKGLTRREALFAGGIVAFGGLTANLLAGCSPQEEGTATASDPTTWDKEADVVVIGAGTGVYTALRTHEAGLETIILESADTPGGSTLHSSSVVWAPANDVMKANGDEDSREEALSYIEAGSEDTYLPELAETYVDNINPALRNVSQMTGMEWAYWNGGIDYRCTLPGGKTMGRSLVPVVEEGASTAGALQTPLNEAADAAGIEILTATPATALITQETPEGGTEVIGVVAQDGSKNMRIKARAAVVLACGGFDWNDDMMTNYLRVPAHYSWGVATAQGAGQKMAMKIDGDMRFMNEGWMSPGYKEQQEEAKEKKMARFATAISDYGKPGVIYVNKHAKRFTNECSNYDSVGRSFGSWENSFEPRGWQNIPAYAIADQTAVDKYGLAGGKPGEPGTCFKSYDSLDSLASALNLDAATLADTVARFNEYAEQGLDPDFGRGQDYYGQNYQRVDLELEGPARTLGPLTTPPFWAAEVVPVVLGSMGGVKVNEKAQALDVDGAVIPRLYAQGNCAGVGCGGAFYVGGGGTIGPALAFGEVAANDIQNLSPQE